MSFDKQTYHNIGIILLIACITILGYILISRVNKRLDYINKVLGIVPMKKIVKEISEDSEDSEYDDNGSEDEEEEEEEEENKEKK